MFSYTSTNVIRQVPITEFLNRLGHHPTKTSGKEIFYKSMLREENTPSLCVNEHMGVWYDHGGANLSGIKGGNIIDLGLAYWYPEPFSAVIRKITEVMRLPIQKQSSTSVVSKSKDLRPLPHYRINKIKELGSNPVLTNYLQKRKIWMQAQNRIKEIYYSIDNGSKTKKYYAVGWKNDLGSWEIRNQHRFQEFKACLGRKAPSTILGDKEHIVLFEGYMDYLSWLRDNPNTTASVIVLNSINMLEQVIPKLHGFTNITAFFDRDKAGQQTFKKLSGTFPTVQDGSYLYRNYKDYNDMLTSLFQEHPYSSIGLNENKIGNYNRKR